ncbi:MAG: hypothetical protein IJH18_00890 [Bacilli bacterium]|nr:hypothetical protein [Bacilli bacterium]
MLKKMQDLEIAKGLFYLSTLMITLGIFIICINIINSRSTIFVYSGLINLGKIFLP